MAGGEIYKNHEGPFADFKKPRTLDELRAALGLPKVKEAQDTTAAGLDAIVAGDQSNAPKLTRATGSEIKPPNQPTAPKFGPTMYRSPNQIPASQTRVVGNPPNGISVGPNASVSRITNFGSGAQTNIGTIGM